jgi:type VI secretion system protein ImpA
MGDEVVAAQPPDWREVRSQAIELFGRTKDLRVVLALVRALLYQDGMVGLAAGLELLKGLLERFWDGVHPRLDPEDANDPTMRVNIIASLGDPDTMLRAVREAPLVSSRLGRFSQRQIEIANGQAPPAPDEPPPERAAIDAAFLDCDLEALQATAAAVAQAIGTAAQIESILTEKVGVARAADLSALPGALKAPQAILAEQLARRGVVDASAPASGAAAAAGGAQPLTGEITSREDVIRVLDKACDYFSRYEPSSPVPLLLRRAKRLVSKNFMEIIRDLTPDGVPQARTITGIESEE